MKPKNDKKEKKGLIFSKMKQMLLVLTISILISSCRTMEVYTTEPSLITTERETKKTLKNKTKLYVGRKKIISKNDAFSFVAKTDSITKNINIEPKHTLFYPRVIYLNLTDTTSRYFLYNPDNKGKFNLHLSLPHINTFRMTPENEGVKINTGFWGLTIGLDYYHSKKQFVNLGFSGVMDFFVPAPAAVDIWGEYEVMSSLYISLSNNHKLGEFTLGYGLSYVRNTWDFRYYDWGNTPPPTRDPVTKSHYSFGFVFPFYYRVIKQLNVGVVYRPSFYRPNMTDKFSYEHLISIDFVWKLRFKK
jgi:hypothetical protein